jgi:hypothetical protein
LGHVDLEPFTLFLVALGTAFLIRWIAQSQPTGVDPFYAYIVG